MPKQPIATGPLVAAVCAACHGVDGNSQRPGVPSLAGQIQPYLEGQLHAFAAQGEQRVSGVMGAIAVNLSADEMKQLATYYARQQLRPATLLEVAPRVRAATSRRHGHGEKLFFEGLPKKGVASCASCHGGRAEGLSDLFPRLAGQHESYLAEQLRRFRARTRTTDPRAMMRKVSARLTDRDIEAVSRYLALLR
ncbi:MAG: c-type cytochrome [Caldimonas sp.]